MSRLGSRVLLCVSALSLPGALALGCAPEAVVSEDASTVNDAATGEDGGVDAATEPDAGSQDPDTGTGDLDAGPTDAGPEPCTAEGMFRTRACECGGTLSEQCTSGFWTIASPCNSNPACTPGAFETRPENPTCADRIEQRTCDPDLCYWTAWQVVRPAGECSPGYVSCSTALHINCDCQDDCTCQPIPGCMAMPL